MTFLGGARRAKYLKGPSFQSFKSSFPGTFLAIERNMKLFSLLAVFLFLSTALAKVQLLVWQPSLMHPRLILPQIEGESPLAAVIRYHKSIKSQSELMSLFPEGGFSVAVGEIKPFFSSTRPTTWLVANDPEDIGAHPQRIKRFIDMFESQGSEAYVLPLASDLRLSEKDRAEYISLLARSAQLAVGLGGSDLTPELFGQKNRYSIDTNLSRDEAEARLWRGFLNEPIRPYIVAVCRSHQFILSLLGYPLVQDIEKELHLESHRNGNHPLQVLNPQGFEKLYSALPHHSSNTFHHQGFVEIDGQGLVEVTARSQDGVIEATVFKDGSGATFQFHPELMSKEVFEAFVRDSLNQAQLLTKRTQWSRDRIIPKRIFSDQKHSCQAIF